MAARKSLAAQLRAGIAWYRRFHGTTPAKLVILPRPEWYQGSDVVVAMGTAEDISYAPDGVDPDSDRRGAVYTHQFGDYGSRKTDERPLLVTDPDGESVYVMKAGQSKYKVSRERGIVG